MHDIHTKGCNIESLRRLITKQVQYTHINQYAWAFPSKSLHQTVKKWLKTIVHIFNSIIMKSIKISFIQRVISWE